MYPHSHVPSLTHSLTHSHLYTPRVLSNRRTSAGARAGFEVSLSRSSNNTLLGLTHSDDSTGVDDVEFAVLVSTSFTLYAYADGAFQKEIGVYEAGDRLRVLLGKDGRPEVFLGSARLYRGTAVFTQRVVVDVSMYSVGGIVSDFRWVDRQEAFCIGVQCAPDSNSDCHTGTSCVLGECVPGDHVREGLACSDGREETVNDTCVAGVCVGADLCANVTCDILPPCMSSGACDFATGSCVFTPLPAGTACNDGLDTTTDDVCDGSGTCMGVDPCDDVTCDEPSTCKPQVSCFLGLCETVFAPAGTECDDGNKLTIDDACDGNGACVGTDPCDGVTCTLGPCHTDILCALGECIATPKEDFVDCDDGNPQTVNDTCIAGSCVGVDLCEGVVCTSPSSPCESETGTCDVRGQCRYPLRPAGATCDDGDARTQDDRCTVDGVCEGVDPCLAVSCNATTNPCRFDPLCLLGECLEPEPKEDGVLCPDTDGNTCTVSACFGGECMAGIPVTDGTVCDDGNNGTIDDRCLSGACVGIDPCDGYTCPEPPACHLPGTCFLGDCSYEPAEDGTWCDDGDDDITALDACMAGTCVGVTQTCTATTSVVELSNGCGGFDLTSTVWQLGSTGVYVCLCLSGCTWVSVRIHVSACVCVYVGKSARLYACSSCVQSFGPATLCIGC